MAEPKVASKVEQEYVEIPEFDMYDNKIVVFHNHEQYEGGKRYLLPSPVAQEVQRMLKIREAADVRILRPKQDSKYRRQLEGHSTAQHVEPE